LKLQLFPTRVAPVIHFISTPLLSTMLHIEYEQGLILASAKY